MSSGKSSSSAGSAPAGSHQIPVDIPSCHAETWLADPDHGTVVTIRDDKGNVKSHGPAPQIAVSERACKEMARLSTLLRLRQRIR